MRRADSGVRKIISSDMRSVMGPVWKESVNQHLTGSGRLEARLLTPGVRIAAGNPPQLIAASSTRRVGRGDLTPTANWQIYEFGSHGTKPSQVTNRKGTTYSRRTRTGLPAYRKAGRVLYPAAGHVLPRIAAYWVQAIVRAFLDAAEGKK